MGSLPVPRNPYGTMPTRHSPVTLPPDITAVSPNIVAFNPNIVPAMFQMLVSLYKMVVSDLGQLQGMVFVECPMAYVTAVSQS